MSTPPPAKRIVVKFGTNVVLDGLGTIALGRMSTHIETLARFQRAGNQVVIVTSGAVGLGRKALGEMAGDSLNLRQALAAIGQNRLMHFYQEAFGHYGIPTAQILLTEEDFSDRTRYLNLRNTFNTLLELGVVPVLNQNDSVSTAELESKSRVFGDNDKLSALVMSKLDADRLILLTNVDGLYEENPTVNPLAKKIDRVETITPAIEALANGKSERGLGGMPTKLEAAKIATLSGGEVLIANGQQLDILSRIFAGEEVGTRFVPQAALRGKKRWIAFASSVEGHLTINTNAGIALRERQASLLSVGIVAVDGTFERGDVVAIRGEDGSEIARGMTNYNSEEVRQMMAQKGHEPVIIRDNLVLYP